MGFLRRLFHRRKDAPSRTSRTREAELEKAWIGGWNGKRRIPSFAKSNNTNASVSMSRRNSEFYFDFDLPSRSPVILGIAPVDGYATTATALQPTASRKQNETCARPPLQAIPGPLLSFPRFQEYVCTFLKERLVPFEDATCQDCSPESKPESDFVEPLTPTKGYINTGFPELVDAHASSLAPSLVDSEVPSLVYSETSVAPSLHSSSANSFLTSPSLTSNHSFFSSSSFSSYFPRRREKDHDTALPPSVAKASEKRKGKKHKMRTTPSETFSPEREKPDVPKVRHANTYVGSRSMSGPYPCIAIQHGGISTTARAVNSLPSPDHIGEYYP